MKDRLREFYLEEIDAWRRGDKATPGCTAMGERYALQMREEVKRLEGLLAELPAEKRAQVPGMTCR